MRFVHINGSAQREQKWRTGEWKIKNSDLTPEKECIEDLAAKRRSRATSNPMPSQKSIHVL
jgi:hypothetical protein